MNLQRLLASLVVLVLVAGCEGPSGTAEKESAETGKSAGVEHKHEPGDELVWELEETIGETGIDISLGHHGSHFHAGDTIEPAVVILKNGETLATAKVFNQLVDPEDTTKTIGREIATVYEPTTEEEIAHYAQGDLVIPAGATSCLVRFRIEIPGAESLVRDMTVKVGH